MLSREAQTKLFAGLLLVLCVLLAVKVHRQNGEISRLRQDAPASEPVNLGNGVVRSGNSSTSEGGVRDAANGSGMPLGPVEADARSRGSQLTGAGSVVFGTGGSTKRDLPSTSSSAVPAPPSPTSVTPALPAPCQTTTCPFAGTVEHLDLVETYQGLNRPVPWGSVAFQASKSATPWSYSVLPRTFTVASVLATKEDGSHDVYSHVRLNVDGKDFDLPIRDARWTETMPEAKWRWSSKLYLGPGFGLSILPRLQASSGFALQASIGSYGKTTAIPRFAVGLLGVGYDFGVKAPTLSLTPVLWNAGEVIPWVDALYFGPSMFVGFDGSISVLATLSAKL